MTILIKLGGSLVTDKHQPRAFRRALTADVARQILAIRGAEPGLRLIIGHGSGSFGHYEARRQGTIAGVRSVRQWLGFAKVGEAASALSQLILAELIAAGLPVMRFQPSSFVTAEAGQIQSLDARLIALALDSGLLPLLHGDVALDSQLGGTILSTEAIFSRLAQELPARRIILLGEVEGVLGADGQLIPEICPGDFARIRSALGGASGVDVTGGMLQKVEQMLALVKAHPNLQAHIADGRQPGALIDLLLEKRRMGTLIRAD